MNYEQFVESRVKWLGSAGLDLHHAATGIMGEVVEFANADSRDNLKEEAGDIRFYILHAVLACQRHGLVHDEQVNGTVRVGKSLPEAISEMTRAAGELLDLTKKVWIYNKPANDVGDKILLALLGIKVNLGVCLSHIGYSIDAAERDNRAKLEKRYPTGYSDAAAQQRADKAEGVQA